MPRIEIESIGKENTNTLHGCSRRFKINAKLKWVSWELWCLKIFQHESNRASDENWIVKKVNLLDLKMQDTCNWRETETLLECTNAKHVWLNNKELTISYRHN